MRALPARRLATTVLCASVLVGVTGQAALAADAAREHGRTASRAPVPAAEKERLLAQVGALGDTNPALTPVLDLLDRSLEQGALPADEARRLGEAAKEAVARSVAAPTEAAAEATVAAPATAAAKPTTPTAKPPAPADLTAPRGSTVPVGLTAPMAARHAHAGAPISRELLDDALSALDTAIDNLVKAVTDGLDQLPSSADDVVSGLVDLLTDTLGTAQTTATGTTATQTPALTALTALSPAATQAAVPAVPAVPSLPPTTG